ncbi:hypothetical protein FisN_3Lh015 [Fistulifera solaris]|uniref:Uncharacterized protein n=1 Tax=Fistulifera solaris TaxID=1519565 RepID=A0A1Z5JZ93_FISSO|nr:hypothetical protein FisN_3Lh015 [Fistulifera solaris]|eukprot:GAX19081.1 hypothetical protein FisN_3Lh015 [Fistulifera solaris]
MRSDLEQAAQMEKERENVAERIIEEAANFLNHADRTLNEIESNGKLGEAIMRTTESLADAVGHVATQLNNQTDDERKLLAQACLQDMQQHHSLLLEVEGADSREMDTEMTLQWNKMSEVTESDITKAIHAAASLLKDVEGTLRAIERDEAEELADVALTVAQIFIASLQSFVSTVTPADLMMRQPIEGSQTIEFLDQTDNSPSSTSYDQKTHDGKEQKRQTKKRKDRMKVLWPPLGPAVASTLQWGTDVAKDRPLLAVALGMTLWPVAAMTALIGCPIILADGFVQHMYSNFENAPLMVGLERGVAQLYHTTRLIHISNKILRRQAHRLLSRQLERHGGVGKIIQNVGGFTLDRVTHPVETVEMAWNSVVWGADSLVKLWNELNDHERHLAVQDLQ